MTCISEDENDIITCFVCISTFFSMLKTAFPLPGIATVNSLVLGANLTATKEINKCKLPLSALGKRHKIPIILIGCFK